MSFSPVTKLTVLNLVMRGQLMPYVFHECCLIRR